MNVKQANIHLHTAEEKASDTEWRLEKGDRVFAGDSLIYVYPPDSDMQSSLFLRKALGEEHFEIIYGNKEDLDGFSVSSIQKTKLPGDYPAQSMQSVSFWQYHDTAYIHWQLCLEKNGGLLSLLPGRKCLQTESSSR